MGKKDFVKINQDILDRWQADYVNRTQPSYPNFLCISENKTLGV